MTLYNKAIARYDELKNAIAASQERVRVLEEALKPFAEQIEAIEATTIHEYSDADTWPIDDDQVVKIGDLRRARATLQNKKPARSGAGPSGQQK